MRAAGFLGMFCTQANAISLLRPSAELHAQPGCGSLRLPPGLNAARTACLFVGAGETGTRIMSWKPRDHTRRDRCKSCPPPPPQGCWRGGLPSRTATSRWRRRQEAREFFSEWQRFLATGNGERRRLQRERERRPDDDTVIY